MGMPWCFKACRVERVNCWGRCSRMPLRAAILLRPQACEIVGAFSASYHRCRPLHVHVHCSQIGAKWCALCTSLISWLRGCSNVFVAVWSAFPMLETLSVNRPVNYRNVPHAL